MLTKEQIINLVDKFERETWKYDENLKLDKDMQYIYFILKKVKNSDEINLKSLYDKLISVIGIIKFKYGFESIIIKENPELKFLKEIIDNVSITIDDIINQYNYILNIYENYINNIKNLDFIENKYIDVHGKEGLCLSIESLKSLITNDEYRKLLDKDQIKDIIIDCIKLNKEIEIHSIELKYKPIIKKVWEQSLSNSIKENENFRVLFSNISGGDLKSQITRLINRPLQSSCSMISSNFIATYGSPIRRVGFIYPNNSEIIMSSSYDLCSNVFGTGSTNKEKGTIIVTPEVLEKNGIMRAKEKGEDLFSSSCYNEVLINAKPCGILFIGLGETDLNSDYQEAKNIALQMNLPFYYLDSTQFKSDLSDRDKYYIAFHSLLSYFNMTIDDYILQCQQNNFLIDNLIDIYKNQISQIFLELKNSGNLTKENMCQLMSNFIDISQINEKNNSL